jgi:SRSO17 transposase
MYRQRDVCEKEEVPFQSKIEIMIEIIRTFTPVEGTVTHVLLDSWYAAKKVWKAVRDRDFLITTGLRCNRSLRIDNPHSPKEWHWQRLDDYAAQLTSADFTRVKWPGSDDERWVYVHVVSTRVKKLYKCQLILVREQLNGQTKFWASSDLHAHTDTLLTHIATRWQIEVLFEDTKELLGIDHYQLMDANAILRFWTLVMAAYCFLEQERNRLQLESGLHTTIGDAWRYTQRIHWRHFIDHLFDLFTKHEVTPDVLYDQLTC